MMTICMKCQNLFSEKNKRNLINVSSAELAQRAVKVKVPNRMVADDKIKFFNSF